MARTFRTMISPGRYVQGREEAKVPSPELYLAHH
jgi:hypothetical protein